MNAESISMTPFHPIETDDLVRVGAPNDGGYVINRRCIAQTQRLVGLGISTNWQFETDFQRQNPACRVIGVDRTVSPAKLRMRAIRYFGKALAFFCIGRWKTAGVKRARATELLTLAREFETFFLRSNNTFIAQHITDVAGASTTAWDEGALAATLHPSVDKHSIFVKMDIEGWEYRVLPAVLQSADLVNGMVIEFHRCGTEWSVLQGLLRDIERHFYLVHVHANNFAPFVDGTSVRRTLEVTFLNKKLLEQGASPSTRAYPVDGLDAPCDPSRPDFPLTF